MVGITAGAVAYDFSQNISPASLGKGEAFQDKDGSSLTEDKTVAPSIKWAGCQLRLTIPCGEGFTGIERRNANRVYDCLAAAGYHHFSIPTPDSFISRSDGISAAGAGR